MRQTGRRQRTISPIPSQIHSRWQWAADGGTVRQLRQLISNPFGSSGQTRSTPDPTFERRSQAEIVGSLASHSCQTNRTVLFSISYATFSSENGARGSAGRVYAAISRCNFDITADQKMRQQPPIRPRGFLLYVMPLISFGRQNEIQCCLAVRLNTNSICFADEGVLDAVRSAGWRESRDCHGSDAYWPRDVIHTNNIGCLTFTERTPPECASPPAFYAQITLSDSSKSFCTGIFYLPRHVHRCRRLLRDSLQS
jgi:hypothetical protein